jgi:hypothetical protein
MRIVLLAAAVALAGCGSARLEGVTERGGLVGFMDASSSDAVALANEHCRRHNQTAEITGPGPQARQLVFRCV